MARNAEKANSFLYRFRDAKHVEMGLKGSDRRPFLATSCNNMSDAERFRFQVMREISANVAKLQDASLTEPQIRDLNDFCNKLFNEKHHWELRIRELGGTDYIRRRTRVLDIDGREVPGARGYKYFGRARDLPGVKELFESQLPDEARKNKYEGIAPMDPEYYGFLDEEDGVLLKYEQGLYEQEKLRYQASLNSEESTEKITETQVSNDREITKTQSSDLSAYFADISNQKDQLVHNPAAHMYLPTQQDIESWIVKRKQQELRDQYAMDI